MPIDALSVSCAKLTRDLLAIAKFLFESVSDPYPQRAIRIRTFLQIDIRIRYDSFSCIQNTGMIEAN